MAKPRNQTSLLALSQELRKLILVIFKLKCMIFCRSLVKEERKSFIVLSKAAEAITHSGSYEGQLLFPFILGFFGFFSQGSGVYNLKASCLPLFHDTPLKARGMELEGEIDCLKVRLTQMEEEARKTRAMNERMMEERRHLREAVAREAMEEAAAARAELAEVRARNSAEVARLQAEVKTAKQNLADELESVHLRLAVFSPTPHMK